MSTPAVVNVIPTTGTDLTGSELVQFDVTDSTPLRSVVVWIQYPNKAEVELVHDNTVFTSHFAVESSRVAISGGWHYNVKRAGGWPDSALNLTVMAVNTAGNEN